jgi:GNAT superfamily N-acetyltransferase
MISVRKFNENDAKSVSNLIRKDLIEINSKDYPQSVIKYMYNEYSPSFLIKVSKEREFLVATISNKIVGSITLFNDYIGTLFVHPKYQKRGIGTLLMQNIETIARKKNISSLKLNSSVNAVDFYINLEYSKGKVNFDENYGITYNMSKNLINKYEQF